MSGTRIAFEDLFPDKKLKIKFNKSTSEATGNNSCNGYSAKYTLDDKSISFGDPDPTTMMFCGEGAPQFLNMMKKINVYSFDADGKLNLIIDDMPMMHFKKTQKDEQQLMGSVAQSDNSISELSKSALENSSYFRASGTEPFLSLEINEERIVFKTPSDSLIMPYSLPNLAQDSNVKRHDVQTTSGRMTIQISQNECTSAMFGKVSPCTVTIDYLEITTKDSMKLEGCGSYIADYRLHDIWVLETLNGKSITKVEFAKEFPTMEITAAEDTFHGFAGCNQMNGRLFFEKGLLRFTNVATTKMMCEPPNKEADFLNALQCSTTYSIENNRLTLSNSSAIITVFKKTD